MATKSATLLWTGTLTSSLLIAWVIGGILFAQVCDHCDRTKTPLLTMLREVHLVFTFLVGFVPLMGIAFMPWVIETKGST